MRPSPSGLHIHTWFEQKYANKICLLYFPFFIFKILKYFDLNLGPPAVFLDKSSYYILALSSGTLIILRLKSVILSLYCL